MIRFPLYLQSGEQIRLTQCSLYREDKSGENIIYVKIDLLSDKTFAATRKESEKTKK